MEWQWSRVELFHNVFHLMSVEICWIIFGHFTYILYLHKSIFMAVVKKCLRQPGSKCNFFNKDLKSCTITHDIICFLLLSHPVAVSLPQSGHEIRDACCIGACEYMCKHMGHLWEEMATGPPEMCQSGALLICCWRVVRDVMFGWDP